MHLKKGLSIYADSCVMLTRTKIFHVALRPLIFPILLVFTKSNKVSQTKLSKFNIVQLILVHPAIKDVMQVYTKVPQTNDLKSGYTCLIEKTRKTGVLSVT